MKNMGNKMQATKNRRTEVEKYFIKVTQCLTITCSISSMGRKICFICLRT